MKKFHQESRVLRTLELCRGTIRRLIKTERASRYKTVSTVFISFNMKIRFILSRRLRSVNRALALSCPVWYDGTDIDACPPDGQAIPGRTS